MEKQPAPRSPFELLIEPIRRTLAESGFDEPTAPQIEAMQPILEGENVLLIAPTGSGKTEACILPVLNNLLKDKPKKGISILYITPMRALNRDMFRRMQFWSEKLGFTVEIRHGDTSQSERRKQSLKPPDLLITTPETLQAILPGDRMRRHLKSVRWVIIDEVHELVEDKRGIQLSIGLERLREVTGRDFQRIGASATVGSPEKVAQFLVGTNRSVRIIQVSPLKDYRYYVERPMAGEADFEDAKKMYTSPEAAARIMRIKELVDSHASTLVFVNSRQHAEMLGLRFNMLTNQIGVHHGSLAREERHRVEDEFKQGKLSGLVCTSTLELGIDIGSVDLVVQYFSPRQVSPFIQRVGRSGHRVNRISEGIVISAYTDDSLEALVIAQRAKSGGLEETSIHFNALDVLTHQVAGIVMDFVKIRTEDAYRIVKRAYPYHELPPKKFQEVVDYMEFLGEVDREGEYLVKRGKTRRYYYENLSMIPDEKTYLIIDDTSEAPIGVLDEAFVAEYGDPGTKFIIRGSPWKIVSVYGDKLYVKPIDDPTGAIPSWIGEEIPVPFKVAREVGEIRGFVEEELSRGTEPKGVASALAAKYPADAETILRATKEIVEQLARGLPIPTHRRIVVERGEEYIVVHACIGSLANRTLATLLGHLISEKTGYATAIQADPYRAMLQCAEPMSTSMVRSILLDLSKVELQALAEEAFKTTGLFKRRMIQVARKFGAVSKTADFSNISLQQLTKSFQDTAIFNEALKTTLSEDADVQSLAAVLQEIRSGETEVVITEASQPTPLALISLEKLGKWTSLISPERMQRLTIESARARLLNEVKTVVCADCWEYIETLSIKELRESFICPNCGSRRIAVLDTSAAELQKIVNRKGRAAADKKVLDYANKAADLIAAHGTRAAIVLAGKNLRVPEAEEILSKASEMDDAFFELIVEAEKKALARRFW